jgi:t-SNARE complex subunit (syntaxin)
MLIRGVSSDRPNTKEVIMIYLLVVIILVIVIVRLL